jgi:FkbM family methyltransferase
MLLDLINLKEKYNLDIKGIIHIGGHFGQEFKTYEQLNIDRVMFFEPIQRTFERLKENVGQKAILNNCALGNFEGEIEMFVEVANQGQSSSILEPLVHLNQYPHITFESKEIVKIKKLDSFIDTVGEYNFINIDVQGYELEVFKGGYEYLNSIDYIMTEVNRDEVYKGCPMVEELDEFLKPYGFERVETTWDGVTWGDAFYVKR